MPSIRVNVQAIEKECEQHRAAAATTLRAAHEPLLQLPEGLMILDKKGRKEDAERLGVIASTIAKDVDVFNQEMTKLDKELQKAKTPPAKKNHLPRQYAKLLDISHRYIDLNGRMMGTVFKSAEDYTEILDPILAEKIKENETQETDEGSHE